MKYEYYFGKYPNKEIIKEINLFAESLNHKLKNLDIGALEIGNDIKKYFRKKQNSLLTNLVKYSYQLSWAISDLKIPKEDIIIIDHGGGTGMFGLLCKEFGIGTVIYNDISASMTKDAEIIGRKLSLRSDHYIAGDINILSDYIKRKSIKCNALVSYNTIEHVYDILDLIRKISSFSDQDFVILMATGANQYNPLTRKTIIPSQINAEYGSPETGLFGNNKPYSEIRKDIITSYTTELSQNEANLLVKATRGNTEPDIKSKVELYLKTKVMPPEPSNKTNTCDPYSGYWAEHFMNPNDLIKIMTANNFKSKLFIGYYGKPSNSIKRLIGLFLNIFLRVFKTKALIIAPYWTLYGKKIKP